MPTAQISSHSRAINLAHGRVPAYSDHTADTTAGMLAQVLYDAGVEMPPDPIADARADTVANAHARLRALICTVIGYVPAKLRKAKTSSTEDDAATNDDAIEGDSPCSETAPGSPMPDNEEELQVTAARRAGKRVVCPTHHVTITVCNTYL
jgi:hypothetical protein